jgi:hypothetical protein
MDGLLLAYTAATLATSMPPESLEESISSMKLTSVEHTGRSQLISGVVRTLWKKADELSGIRTYGG